MIKHPNNARLAVSGLYILGLAAAFFAWWGILSATSSRSAPWGYALLPTFLHFCCVCVLLDEDVDARWGLRVPFIEKPWLPVALAFVTHFLAISVMLSAFQCARWWSPLQWPALIGMIMLPIAAPIIGLRLSRWWVERSEAR